MKDELPWIIDNQEKNKYLVQLVQDDPEFEIKNLTMEDYVKVPLYLPNPKCGDMTWARKDGMIEFKKISDWLSSTTYDGSYHLESEVVTMYTTGLPNATIIYGDRFHYQRENNVPNETILQAYQKTMKIAAVWKTAVSFVGNEYEAIETAKTFLRKCHELPKRPPIYNLFKNNEDYSAAMLMAAGGIGRTIAYNIIGAYGNAEGFLRALFDALDTYKEKKALKVISKKVDKLGPIKLKSLINVLRNVKRNE